MAHSNRKLIEEANKTSHSERISLCSKYSSFKGRLIREPMHPVKNMCAEKSYASVQALLIFWSNFLKSKKGKNSR